MNDKQVVFTASTNNYPNSIMYASKKLLNDINFLVSICLKRKDLRILYSQSIPQNIKIRVKESLKLKIYIKSHQNIIFKKLPINLINIILIYLLLLYKKNYF